MGGNWTIGIDEAGRGPVIGPLVVAALAIPNEEITQLSKLGVKDSKEISRSERVRISEEISRHIEQGRWKSGIVICKAKRIDINSISSDLNSLEIELFSEAISEINIASKDGTIKADACDVNEERFRFRLESALGDGWGNWNIHAEHGMDSKDLVTGGASILAKVTRDSAIQEISSRTGLDVGSGYPSDQKTRKAVETLLSDGNIHDSIRWSWATVSDIWEKLHTTPVPVRSKDGNYIVQSSLDDWRV